MSGVKEKTKYRPLVQRAGLCRGGKRQDNYLGLVDVLR